MDDSLRPFFRPRGVVVIGVSTSEEKLGHGIARNLSRCRFPGPVHFVGQSGGRLFDRPIHSNLAQVPDPVDLAIIAVPPTATPEVLLASGKRGIRAAIIVSAGFRETGEQGSRLEASCLDVARAQGIRLLGPNCIGIIDTHLPLDTTFLQPPMPSTGSIGFVSHSGAFCAAIIDWARSQGFGFSQIVSVGNQTDVTEIDMLEAVGDDPNTNVIVLYLEGISDGRRFVAVASEVSRRKPVIALKVGRSEFGRSAAASHTGALAGSDHAYDAAFERCGVLRADTAEEMFVWARALALCPGTAGSRVAILTNAGGPGVIAADSVASCGLSLARLSESTRGDIAAILPASASLRNPVDMLASATPDAYAQCARLLLLDEGVDGLVVILPPPPMFRAEHVADALMPVIRESGKPILLTLMGSSLTAAAFERFTAAGVPVYAFPESAVSAFGALVRRAAQVASEPPLTRPPADWKAITGMEGMSGDQLMQACRIPTPASGVATGESRAVDVARSLGFPVVLKIASPDIPHRSDVGAVILHVNSEPEVREGYGKLLRRVLETRPEARVLGVQVQQEIGEGSDVILGMVRDRDFGPLLMFGSGGIEVEALRDVAFALAPVSAEGAMRLMRRTWAGRRLAGYRNLPAADEGAVVDALVRLSWLVYTHPELEEIEINPLRVLAIGRGAYALDVRVKRSETAAAAQAKTPKTVT